MSTWGNVQVDQNAMAGVIMQTFEKQGGQETIHTNIAEQNTLRIDNERLRVVNKEFMAKCINLERLSSSLKKRPLSPVVEG